MTVADLQNILTTVGQLLASGGGKGADQLATFREALNPFRELNPKQFGDAIKKLLEEKPIKGKIATKKAKPTDQEIESLAREIQQLYDRAADPGTTMEMVEDSLGRLNGLGQVPLSKVAEAVGLVGYSKKKIDTTFTAIRQRIFSRMGNAQKVGRIDRSPFVGVEVR